MTTSSEHTASVVVWGGGSGGVAAALQAARSGAETLLLTPGPWLGGMVSAAGVCAPDGNELTPWHTGLWGALLRALASQEPEGLDQNWVSCFGWQPATAEAILRRWVTAETRLVWWPLCRVREVERQGDRIRGLWLERGAGGSEAAESAAAGADRGRKPESVRVIPRIVVDGSDRGDLLPLAGAPFRLGWEAREEWGEPSAPPRVRLESDPFFREQPVQSPTWVAMGQLTGAALPKPSPGSQPSGPGLSPGAAAVPVLPEPFAEATTTFGLERTITYGRLPGGLVMLNWPLHGNDWHQGLARAFADDGAGPFPSGLAEAELAQEMRAHSLAFAEALQAASGGWLQPAAAFPTAEAAARGALHGAEPLALMPYWREGRRLVGRELVLEQHLLPQGPGACIAPLPLDEEGRTTAIAVGNYANDHHYPGPDWPLAPKSCRWGGRWSGTPFAIPYGALVSEGIVNLLAADKCLSVSHMANGATRLQPLVLNLGQAAGMAAALCVREGLDPAELPVGLLQEALLADPQAPAGPVPLWDTPWHHPLWSERQRAVLQDPTRLDRHGHLAGAVTEVREAGFAGTLSAHAARAEPHERLWQGELVPDGQGGYELRSGSTRWMLITLEPEVHRWLLDQHGPRPVRLIGCLNPWGPWLRVSRLADQS